MFWYCLWDFDVDNKRRKLNNHNSSRFKIFRHEELQNQGMRYLVSLNRKYEASLIHIVTNFIDKNGWNIFYLKKSNVGINY